MEGVRRSDLIRDFFLMMVFLGTFLVLPFIQRDFSSLMNDQQQSAKLVQQAEIRSLINDRSTAGTGQHFKNPMPSPEEIKRIEQEPIRIPLSSRKKNTVPLTLPPPPPFKERNVTRLTAAFQPQVIPPVIHMYKPTYVKKADKATLRQIESLETVRLLQVPPGNITYPKVYKKGELFHIIKTRFMQHQPRLLELGKARLELFKTFCLPSMLHQTTQNFFWIIYTDPELHPDLLKEMKKLLKPYPHFYLLPALMDKVRERKRERRDRHECVVFKLHW